MKKMGWFDSLTSGGGVSATSGGGERARGSLGDPFTRDDDDPRTPSPSRDLYKAFHEAAHAWAFVSGGFDVLLIELVGSGGAVWFTPHVREDLSPTQIKSLLVATVAGEEGGIHYWTHHQRYSLSAARVEVRGDDSGDRKIFDEYAAGTSWTWEGLRPEARRLVGVHSQGILSTANALVAARELRSIVA